MTGTSPSFPRKRSSGSLARGDVFPPIGSPRYQLLPHLHLNFSRRELRPRPTVNIVVRHATHLRPSLRSPNSKVAHRRTIPWQTPRRRPMAHPSPPWPNHLYMTCFRTQPISKSDIGTLHIDLVEGTAWFEGWHGKEDTRVFERKQINIRCHSSKSCHVRLWRLSYS